MLSSLMEQEIVVNQHVHDHEHVHEHVRNIVLESTQL